MTDNIKDEIQAWCKRHRLSVAWLSRAAGFSENYLRNMIGGYHPLSQSALEKVKEVMRFYSSERLSVQEYGAKDDGQAIPKKPRKGRPKSKMPVAVAQLILETVAGHPDWTQPQVAQYVTEQAGYKVYQKLVSLVVNNPESYTK